MKQYTDGERAIFATDKAYKLLYKNQGFKPIKEAKPGEVDFETLDFNNLRKHAKEKGIEGYGKMKKDELIEALKGADEDDPAGTTETID